jgi:hypothetical protein
MLSIPKRYYQLFLKQPICVGLGAGIVITPSVAAALACLLNPATREKAMGLMVCSSTIGMYESTIINITLNNCRWYHLFHHVSHGCALDRLPIGSAQHSLCGSWSISSLLSRPVE